MLTVDADYSETRTMLREASWGAMNKERRTGAAERYGGERGMACFAKSFYGARQMTLTRSELDTIAAVADAATSSVS